MKTCKNKNHRVLTFFPFVAIIVIIRNDFMFQTAVTLIDSIMRACDVLILYATVLIVFSLYGMILLAETVNKDKIESSYQNIIRSTTTSFVFLTTGENYAEVVYEAIKENPYYLIYYLTLVVIGMLIVIPVIIQRFQETFNESYVKSVEYKLYMKKRALFAGFTIIDVTAT